ncbi:hypothetical protein Ga0080559_TMP1231 [Salipiger profundus]|uniref:Uncharacterized protein n=1 Tax=Salipiger profundus TaxID=1229727 RepID=A0A1U7D1J2_9RHOB|nr:hypothetical protein Ga0080559_TMP1231 [Salipiger profundus]
MRRGARYVAPQGAGFGVIPRQDRGNSGPARCDAGEALP